MLSCCLLLLCASLCSALELSNFCPSSLPLAVKTPYLSTWIPKCVINEQETRFWTGDGNDWIAIARVDGKVYTLMGVPNRDWTPATQTKLELTATRTIFTLQAGPIQVIMTFFTPISLGVDNLLRQSLPFSYLEISINSVDQDLHLVELYTEIGVEFVTGNPDVVTQWSPQSTPSDMDQSEITYLSLSRSEPRLFEETQDRIDYGQALYASRAQDAGIGTTYSFGREIGNTRNDFVGSGRFMNQSDVDWRSGNDRRPVFGFAYDFGDVSTASKSVLNVVGHTRDPALQYMTSTGIQIRHEYWRRKLEGVEQAIQYVFADYEAALEEAEEIDARIEKDAIAAHSDSYAALCALSARQVPMATEITVGSLDPAAEEDVMVFVKEISSNGNIQTTDVIFPSMPIFLYLSPAYLELMLEPSYLYQASGLYEPLPAAHDIGNQYPNATGHDDYHDAPLPVEECADMIFMALAIAQQGRTQQADKYYELLKRWAKALEELALYPKHQLSTDDFQGRLANQTSLALKGLIGIKAMSALSSILGHAEDAQAFDATANDYLPIFLDLATSADRSHLTLSYGNHSSWATMYNLYADVLLGLNYIPAEVYLMQEKFYGTVMAEYGLPLDSRSSISKTDWAIFAAAAITHSSGKQTRDTIIAKVMRYLHETSFDGPLSDLMETSDGSWHGFRARPVVGAHFALLAHPQRFKMQSHAIDSMIRPTLQMATLHWQYSTVLAFSLMVPIFCFFVWRRRSKIGATPSAELELQNQPLLQPEETMRADEDEALQLSITQAGRRKSLQSA